MSEVVANKFFVKRQHYAQQAGPAPEVEKPVSTIPVIKPIRFSNKYDLNIYTHCQPEQYDFIPNFVSALKKSNPNAHIEILVADDAENLPSLSKFPNASYHNHEWLRSDVNGFFTSYNFLIEPELATKYIQVLDITDMNQHDIMKSGLAVMKKTGLPYANKVRSSGIHIPRKHFTEYKALFPHKFGSQHNIAHARINSETLLLRIIESKGLSLIMED